MDESLSPAVFFDIGGTLASPKLSSPPPRLDRLIVYPYVPTVLQELRDRRVRLGVISNTGDETAERMQIILEQCGLYDFFDPSLLLYSSVVGLEKDSPEIFRLAASRAGHPTLPERCIFVGEDSRERSFALAAGLRAASHPLLAREVLDGAGLRYVRVTVPNDGGDTR
ncbi:MAG: HAD family hydrolase, partial [Pseudomonadota bacterium]|nr:HAD family hydrolase [Pseudomonadota bacterium]